MIAGRAVFRGGTARTGQRKDEQKEVELRCKTLKSGAKVESGGSHERESRSLTF